VHGRAPFYARPCRTLHPQMALPVQLLGLIWPRTPVHITMHGRAVSTKIREQIFWRPTLRSYDVALHARAHDHARPCTWTDKYLQQNIPENIFQWRLLFMRRSPRRSARPCTFIVHGRAVFKTCIKTRPQPTVQTSEYLVKILKWFWRAKAVLARRFQAFEARRLNRSIHSILFLACLWFESLFLTFSSRVLDVCIVKHVSWYYVIVL
jgi:hypothetical protein